MAVVGTAGGRFVHRNFMPLGVMLAVVAVAVLLQGCGSTALNRAPVEDRGSSAARQPQGAPAPISVTPALVAPLTSGAENAGLPGYYTVKSGDTLIRIGLDTGQNWRDIVRWNAIENPNVIEVGQVLRVVPPGATTVMVRPVTSAVATPSPLVPAAPVASAPSQIASSARPAAPTATVAPAPDDDVSWIWPSSGVVLSPFDETKNKGIDIGGASGEAVVAAADGRVVYVGAGLRGYGNLIILKHNNTYLTAYAHNQTLLVKEDQSVRKGQKIAEMGSSDADRVKLHFEVRRQGKPVDPAKYLPPR